MRAVALVLLAALCEPAAQARPLPPGSAALLPPVTSRGISESQALRVSGIVSSYASLNLGLKVSTPATFDSKQLHALARCTAPCPVARRIAASLRKERLLLIVMDPTARGFSLSVIVFDGASGNITGEATREIVDSDELFLAARDLTHLAVLHVPRDPRGLVRISAPEGATIEVDGQAVGQAPLPQPLRVAPGAHALRFAKPGFLPDEQQINAVTGQETDVAVELKVVPAAPPLPLSAATTPAAASVPVFVERPVKPSRSSKQPPWLRKLGWALGAGGVGVLATAIGLGVAARQHESHLQSTLQSAAAVQREVNSARAEAISTDVLLVAGSGMGIAGVSLVVGF